VDISRGFAAFAVDGNAESRLAVRSPTCAFAGRTFATGQGADDDDKDEDAAEDDILTTTRMSSPPAYSRVATRSRPTRAPCGTARACPCIR
jgi:hypothetical protein